MTVKRDGPSTPYEMVEEFHGRFEHPIGASAGVPLKNGHIDWPLIDMRMRLIKEETRELSDALDDLGDLQPYPTWVMNIPEYSANEVVRAVADALGDLIYVVNGKALVWGIDLDATVREIHRSNMTKLGEDGRPILRSDGKILKGPNYEPPALSMALISR